MVNAIGVGTSRSVMSRFMRRLPSLLCTARIRSPIFDSCISAVLRSVCGARSSTTQIGVFATADSVVANVSEALPGRVCFQTPLRACQNDMHWRANHDFPFCGAPTKYAATEVGSGTAGSGEAKP